jgi:hypothetical protein
MKQLQQSLEIETRTVYQYARLVDVCDKYNNCRHISVDDAFIAEKGKLHVCLYSGRRCVHPQLLHQVYGAIPW